MIRKIRRTPTGQQFPLLRVEPAAASAVRGIRGEVAFEAVDRSRLYIGDIRLDDYLRGVGKGWIVGLQQLIAELDVAPFRERYEGTGRRPYHPHVVVGLVVYGALQGRTSLRELEELAVIDVGAWWMCGGQQPDHSVIGRFLRRHQEHLSEAFFLEVTEKAFKQLGLRRGTVAIDGTVVEAATSKLRLMRHEALTEAAEKASEEAAKAPDDVEKEARADLLKKAVAVADERQQKRIEQGKPGDVKVAAEEPEAVNQLLKSALERPAYKPTLGTHESGLVVGQTVVPSNENDAVSTLMAQHQKVVGATPQRLLLDGGFFNAAMLTMLIDDDVDVLCPPPGTRDKDYARFPKAAFEFDANTDIYRCPGGQELVAIGRGSMKRGGPYTKYQASPTACEGCELRSRCTTSKMARTLKRFENDDEKDAMRAVLGDRRAQKAYRARAPIAETSFATIKNVQQLKRFRRRGLAGAKLEVSLHCIALNLGRAAVAVAVLAVDRQVVAAWIIVTS